MSKILVTGADGLAVI